MTDKGVSEWLISVDDHVLEPGHVWQDRLPAKYPRGGAAARFVTPTVRRGSMRASGWSRPGLGAVAGKRREEFSFEPITYDEMRPGCYDSVARLEDMDRAGVLASLCFPSFPRFCGQVFLEADDKELAHAVRAGLQRLDDRRVVRSCARSLHPAHAHPPVGPGTGSGRGSPDRRRRVPGRSPSPRTRPCSVSRRSRTKGAIGTLSWQPARRPETVVCMHIGSSSMRYTMSDESPMLVTMSWGPPVMIAGAMVEWIFSPVSCGSFPASRSRWPKEGSGGCRSSSTAVPRSWRSTATGSGRGDVRHDSLSGHVRGHGGRGRRNGGLLRHGHLPQAHLRLLHRRSSRDQESRCHRGRQRHDRDRLSPQRLDLAELPRACPEAARRSPRRRSPQDPAGKRRATVPVHARATTS